MVLVVDLVVGATGARVVATQDTMMTAQSSSAVPARIVENLRTGIASLLQRAENVDTIQPLLGGMVSR
jgi:hypothetical protein